jgi:hypothetical protein
MEYKEDVGKCSGRQSEGKSSVEGGRIRKKFVVKGGRAEENWWGRQSYVKNCRNI